MNQNTISWSLLASTIVEVYELMPYIQSDLTSMESKKDPVTGESSMSAGHMEEELIYDIENNSQFADLDRNALDTVLRSIIQTAFSQDAGSDWHCTVDGVPGQEQPGGVTDNYLMTYIPGGGRATNPGDLQNSAMVAFGYSIPLSQCGNPDDPSFDPSGLLPSWLKDWGTHSIWKAWVANAMYNHGAVFGTQDFAETGDPDMGQFNIYCYVDDSLHPPALVVQVALPASQIPSSAVNAYPNNKSAFSGILQGIMKGLDG